MRRGIRVVVAAAVLLAAGVSGALPGGAAATLTFGALFPTSGPMAQLAGQELAGIEIARDMVNAGGGADGRMVVLDTQPLNTPDAAPDAVHALAARNVPVIIGTFSSALSIPASAAAAAAGITYWESGAVADQVTGRHLPGVFRVGADGGDLGRNSATFAATVLAARLVHGRALRVSVVYEDDSYGRSVGEAAAAEARRLGLDVAGVITYNAYLPAWPAVFAALRAQHADTVVLASYIGDGVAFRREMLATGFHTGALVGSTMAECGPDFGAMLGADSIGVFASDRPGDHFNRGALAPAARAVYDDFARRWRIRTGADPTEEGIAGFSSAWALFHDVVPHAAEFTAAGVAAAARSTVLAPGSLPNGAGMRFSNDPATLGQNLDAAAVIWQWQAAQGSVNLWPSGETSAAGGDPDAGTYTHGDTADTWSAPGAVNANVVVWPPLYATGTVTDVPLAR